MTNRSGSRRPHSSLGVAALAVLLCFIPPATADLLPLPPEAQERVEQAIDKGVAYLKQIQTRYPQGMYGTWAKDNNHKVGYTALPGLTLLECGVSPKDEAVQRAANFVRASAAKLDQTYDLALAVLFLDRLGEAKDKSLIQVLTLRLVAGQSPTGGWGYKCPILDGTTHQQLLTVLKKLEPPVLFDPLQRDQPGVLTGSPGTISSPGLDNPVTQPKSGGTEPKSTSPGEKSPGEKAPPTEPSPGALADPARGDGARPASLPDSAFRRWGWCLKMQDEPPSAATTRKSTAPKAVVIPGALRNLPVVADARTLPLRELSDKNDVPIYGRTDNSNTQFALLALWASRRHSVPATRTLNLITRRFLTSQNGDGSWGYHYKFGGGEPERPPMTCVGLLGLAIGYGLANEAGVGPKGLVRDPRIVQGFAALSKNVGTPTGKMEGHAQKNLYFLWSVERVGVLYNIGTINNKDWYRWGAEILVANQQREGNWTKGGYHGANETVDTCLALLFLKRANLAADLEKRLPFDTGDLQQAIADTMKPANPPPAPKTAANDKDKEKEKAKALEYPVDPVEPIETAKSTSKKSAPDNVSLQKGGTTEGERRERAGSGGGAWLWIVLLLLLLVAGLVVAFFLWNRKDANEGRSRKRSKSSKGGSTGKSKKPSTSYTRRGPT